MLTSFLFAALTAPVPTDTLHYVVLMQGNLAGTQTVWTAPDGRRNVRYEYNDRGRGPSLTATIRLGDGGVPVSVAVDGNDYFKGEVNEWFSIVDGVASWRNAGERDRRPVSGTPFYVTFASTPEDFAILVRALLASPDSALPLLPEGTARVRRSRQVEEVVVAGGTRTLTYFTVEGLAFTPTGAWFDEAGEMVATLFGWLVVVRQGWESVIPVLQEAQEEVAAERDRALAQRLARVPNGPLAFTNARVFDVESGTYMPHTTVLVNGSRIEAVGPDGSVDVPPDAMPFNLSGMVLMPGLWDMHVHLSGTAGILHLAAGVTSTRDLANDTDQILRMRREFDNGITLGPRVVLGGFMDGPGPYAGPTRVLVSTEGEARQAIDEYARLGFEQIKIYSSIRPDLVPFIARYTREHGLKLSGHIPAFMTAEQAVLAGFDEIQHVNMMFLNFLGDTLDTRTPLRFTTVARHARDLDLASDSVQRFLNLLKQRNVVVDPTVAIFENQFTSRPGDFNEGVSRFVHRLPPGPRRGFLGGGLPVTEEMDSIHRESFRVLLSMVKALHDHGITIVPGTDAIAGFTLHRELELYAEAGIPRADVLRIATIESARVAGRADRLGSIEPGKLADLIVVAGDPLSDMTHIRRVDLVMKDGILYDPAELYRALGVIPWRDAPNH